MLGTLANCWCGAWTIQVPARWSDANPGRHFIRWTFNLPDPQSFFVFFFYDFHHLTQRLSQARKKDFGLCCWFTVV